MVVSGCSVLMNTNIQTRPPQGGQPPMEAGDDWRSQLQSESRHRIVAKMYVFITSDIDNPNYVVYSIGN